MPARILLIWWLAFLVGIMTADLALVEASKLLLYVVVGVGLSSVAVLLSPRIGVAILAVVAGLLIGHAYYNYRDKPNEYLPWVGQTIDWQGVITVQVEPVDRNQQLRILPDGFSQQIIAFHYFPLSLQVGDRVWLRGEVALPKSFGDFDYAEYLADRNVYAQLQKPQVIAIQRAHNSPRNTLAKLKHQLVRRTSAQVSGDAGSLLLGMLIGYRSSISQSLEEALRVTGTSHIVAVSGFNMTIVAVSCGALAWWLGRKPTFVFTVFAVISFAILTGGQASVVRAAIMSLLAVYAQFVGRFYHSANGLVWASGLMVLHNPKILIGDIGFQLSVAATLGLLAAHRWQANQSENLGLAQILRTTAFATVFTAPLIAYYFQTFSTVSLLVNMMILPLVPWVMLIGALALIPMIGLLFVPIATQLVGVIIEIILWFGQLSFAVIELELSWPELLIAYVLLAVVFFARRQGATGGTQNSLSTQSDNGIVKKI